MNEPVRTVLAATDLQSTSREVVDVAGAVARAAGARLHLVHVVEPGEAGHVPKKLREEWVRERSTEAARALELQGAALESEGTRVEIERVATGSAHREISERIEKTEADLVVFGSHAREGHGHRLGSTADRILRTSPVPCLVVRGRVRLPMTPMALLTDFSPHAARAADVAAGWLEVLGGPDARLDVVHVGHRYDLDLDPSLEEILSERLAEAATALKERVDPERVGARLYDGDHPVDALVEISGREGYALLVMGTHGHGPVHRALLGSVAMGLVQSAPCPVLVVPAVDGR